MKRRTLLICVTVVALVACAAAGFMVLRHATHTASTPHTTTQPQTKSTPKSPAPSKPQPKKPAAPKPKPALVEPVKNFRARITKKFFGTYITPQTSPVQPERFMGYHAGVDAEYGDVAGTVPVHAIADGQVVYASWVSGYGGVTILRHQINGAPHLVLYGHLNVASLLPVGTNVKQRQQIGVLGVGYSQQTDGERRHLHFAILAGNSIDVRGYAQSKAQLSAWLNPLDFKYGGL